MQVASEDEAVLDNPVWHSLAGAHAHFAQGHGRARRYRSDVSMFAGLPDDRDGRAWQDLADLIGPGSEVILSAVDLDPPKGWEAVFRGAAVQMVDVSVDAAPDGEAVRLGVELRHGVDARQFRVDGARISGVETSTGIVKANEYVLCAGVWSTKLARLLGLALPMQAGKGYSLTLEKVPGSMRGCAILSEARASVTPMGASLRVGGTMEITGIDETVEPARIRGIVKSIGTYLPDMTPARLAEARVRTGLRPCSPDGLPYIGRFAKFANLSAATGHAMMGVSLAPITGELIAQVLSGEKTSISISALSPDRFARSRRASPAEAAAAVT